MKLTLNQLKDHLNQGLAPIYLVSGDEYLLKDDCVKTIEAKARSLQYADKQTFTINADFKWDTLLNFQESGSLFAEKKIIHIHSTGTLTDPARKALVKLAQNLSPDTLIIVQTNKLSGSAKNAKWVKTIEAHGVWLSLWPLKENEFSGWLQRELKKCALQLDHEAFVALKTLTTGNLLAARQAIYKLQLLDQTRPLDHKTIRQTLSDNSNFDIFDLIQAMLEGDAAQCVKIIQQLMQAGEPLPKLITLLHLELRQLLQMSHQSSQGENRATIFKNMRIWYQKQRPLTAALNRHGVNFWRAMIVELSELDIAVKRFETSSLWMKFELIVLKIAGKPLLAKATLCKH